MTNTFRCVDGHTHEVDFGDEMKLPCPTCGIDIFKFRDFAANDDMPTIESEVDKGVKGKINLSRNQKIAFGAAAVLLCAFVGVSSVHTEKPQKDLGTASVLPMASKEIVSASKPVSKPVADNIGDVVISDFKVTLADRDSVKISFVLTNKGDGDNAYPSLKLHWKGSSAPDLTIGSDNYAHPSAKFTRVTVETALQRPADATGVDVSVKY